MNELVTDDSVLELSSKASSVAFEPRCARLQNNSPGSPTTPVIVDGELVHAEPPEEFNRFSSYLTLSTFFFFSGSIFYLVTSIWNIVDAYRDAAEEEGYDDDEESQGEDYYEPFWNFYKLVSSLGATMYLANALVDGRVAFGEIRGQVDAGGRFEGVSPKVEIAAATTFGVAALCDLVSELIWYDKHAWPGYFAGCAAVDIYLVNAILVLSARKPTFKSLPETMMSAGDILFLIGSIIDVLISLIDNPRAPSSRFIEIAWSSFVSAALWFIDSLLYIVADHLSLCDDYSSVDSYASLEEELEISSASVTGSADLGLHHRFHHSTDTAQQVQVTND